MPLSRITQIHKKSVPQTHCN